MHGIWWHCNVFVLYRKSLVFTLWSDIDINGALKFSYVLYNWYFDYLLFYKSELIYCMQHTDRAGVCHECTCSGFQYKYYYLFFRPHRVVCLCGHTDVPCTNGRTDRDALWETDFYGSKEPCFRWRSRSDESICSRDGDKLVIWAHGCSPMHTHHKGWQVCDAAFSQVTMDTCSL